MNHSELIEAGKKWLKKSQIYKYGNNQEYFHYIKCQFGFSELVTMGSEIPDIIGFSGNLSVLIECKTSRSDFKADFKKIFRNKNYVGMGNLKYYLTEKGLLKIDEIPKKWGLLEVENKKVKIIKNAELDMNFEIKSKEQFLFYSIIRRIKNKENIDKYLF